MRSLASRPRSAGEASSVRAKAAPKPGLAEHETLGNSAIQEAMAKLRVTEERGSIGLGPASAAPGSAAAAGVRSAAGTQGAAEAAQHADAQVITGQRWGDTFGAGRINGKGGAGDMGLGRFSRDGYTGGGEGHTSSGGIESDEERAAQKDQNDQQWGAASDMSDSDKESYLADQFYGGFASMEEFQAYADQVKAEAAGANVSRPREDDLGGAQTGPNPLSKQKSPAKKAGKGPGLVGGPGDGRGTQEPAGGAGMMDGKYISVKAGGGTDKERKAPESNDVSMEQALKANFHTDPTRT